MAVIKGQGSFGVSGSENLAQSKSVNKTADTAELRNKDGDVVGLAIYNEREEITLDVGVPSGGTLPAVGDTLEGGIVTAVNTSESNTAFKTASVTIVKYNSLVVGAGA